MTEEFFSSDARGEAVEHLRRVAESFQGQLGGRPTLGEFLEILTAAIPADSNTINSHPGMLRFSAKLAGNRKYSPARESRVADLNDSTFVDASDFLEFIGGHIAKLSGRRASPSELSAAVHDVLRTSNVMFDDVTASSVSTVKADVLTKAARPKVGDVIAIPVDGKRFRVAVVVARNRFGTALGILDGVSPVRRVAPSQRKTARLRPVYTDDQLILSGAWAIVGHDNELASLFPAEPEIYHSADPIFPNTEVGEFGAAESPTGVMRLITEQEAAEAGLIDNTYRQVYLSNHLGQLLADGTL